MMKCKYMLFGNLIATSLLVFSNTSADKPGSNKQPLSFGSDQTIVALEKLTGNRWWYPDILPGQRLPFYVEI